MTIIDLSHVIADGTVTYPGLPAPTITDHLTRHASREIYAEGVEFQIGHIDMVSNTGTYMDTPFHRFEGGYDLSELDLSRVAGVRGLVIDARADQSAAASLLDGIDVSGAAVLFWTGWDRHWASEQYGDPSHPFVSVEAARQLVDRGAAVVGIDSVNVDDTRTGERPIHTVLLGAGVPIIEHMTGLGHLEGRDFAFHAVPPAIAGMGTFPVHAYAIMR